MQKIEGEIMHEWDEQGKMHEDGKTRCCVWGEFR
jgi:hypothetical protein